MNSEQLIKELTFKAIRSSGAGGQHVNKVSSKIVLFFDVNNSLGLTTEEKELLLSALKTKLNTKHMLILSCDDTRSQHRNKELVIQRFLEIIRQGLIVQKERKETKVPKAVLKKRLDNKKKLSAKKANRKKPDIE